VSGFARAESQIDSPRLMYINPARNWTPPDRNGKDFIGRVLALNDRQNSAWRPQGEALDAVAASGAAAVEGPSHAAKKPTFARGSAL
jgi:hypothetical protein